MSAPRQSGRSLYKSGVQGGAQAEQNCYAYTGRMAKTERVLIEYIDDLDSKPVDQDEVETVTFALGTKTYQLDLRPTNKAKLEKALEPFIKAATPVGRAARTRQRPGTGSGRSKEQLAAIRHWLRQNGHDVSDRGRIPQPLIDEFDKAH